jgi:hypothetical protein
MMCCEGTEAMWELVLDLCPSSWEPVVRVAMWLVCHVMLLPNVDCSVIIPAVVWMVAERLHSELSTSPDHVVCVGPASCSCACELEGVSASSGTVARPQDSRKALLASTAPASNEFCTHDLVVLSRSLPPVVIAIRTQCAVVASMMCCEGTELARELVLDVAPASWEPAVMFAMWLVCNVVSLANVD